MKVSPVCMMVVSRPDNDLATLLTSGQVIKGVGSWNLFTKSSDIPTVKMPLRDNFFPIVVFIGKEGALLSAALKFATDSKMPMVAVPVDDDSGLTLGKINLPSDLSIAVIQAPHLTEAGSDSALFEWMELLLKRVMIESPMKPGEHQASKLLFG